MIDPINRNGLKLSKEEKRIRRSILELKIAMRNKKKYNWNELSIKEKKKVKQKAINEVSNFIHRITPFLSLMSEDATRTPIVNKNKRYYVYLLINPDTKRIFYIGKGQFDRMYDHEELARRNIASNGNFKLYETIKNIIRQKSIIYRKIFFTDFDYVAIDVEQYLIAYFGLSNLCNIQPGGARKII